MTTTRRAAVLGSPIDHSLSPILHRAAYTALDLDWEYTAIDVDESSLPAFWASVDETWVGLSLTMPLKTAVLSLLDGISDRARSVGAVNTVVFDRGRTFGHNTDIPGMIRSLDEASFDRARIRSAGIVGAGATARSALAAIIERHGVDLPLMACARRDDQVRELAGLASRWGCRVQALPWSRRDEVVSADLVVATPPGKADLLVPIPPTPGLLLDVAYDPWPTPLSTRWREAGGVVATGADLLLWQACDQVELMTLKPAPVDAMRSALLAALDDRAITPI